MIKTLWTNKTVRKRFLYTLLLLILFQIGTRIPLPGLSMPLDLTKSDNTMYQLLNLSTGGAFSRFGLLALGVSPYIMASLLIQLLSDGVIKYLTFLRDQGEAGKTRLGQMTRYITLFFGFFMGLTLLNSSPLMFTQKENLLLTKCLIAVVLSVGGLFTEYLAERIHVKGIGNGPSLIIASGVMTQVPNIVKRLWQYSQSTNEPYLVGVIYAALVVYLMGMVFVENIEYRIPLQSFQSAKTNSGHYLPLKLLMSSVAPVIFATMFISLGGIIFQALKLTDPQWTKWVSLGSLRGSALYGLLIVLMSYVYNPIQIGPERLSQQIQRSSMYIQNVPTPKTESYLSTTITKITHLGGPILMFIAVLPVLLSKYYPGLSAISGTSFLILIAVANDFQKQIIGLASKENYQELIRKEVA